MRRRCRDSGGLKGYNGWRTRSATPARGRSTLDSLCNGRNGHLGTLFLTPLGSPYRYGLWVSAAGTRWSCWPMHWAGTFRRHFGTTGVSGCREASVCGTLMFGFFVL